jgi:hypothetical protein
MPRVELFYKERAARRIAQNEFFAADNALRGMFYDTSVEQVRAAY